MESIRLGIGFLVSQYLKRPAIKNYPDLIEKLKCLCMTVCECDCACIYLHADENLYLKLLENKFKWKCLSGPLSRNWS